MANRSVFPDQIDSFNYLSEVLASDKTNIDRYQVLVLKENRTAEEDTELANLKTTLATKIVSSESFNKLFDCIVNLESFFKNDVEAYLDTLEVGALRTDIGVPTDLTTTAKTNVVAAVNEVQSELNTANSSIGTLSTLITTSKTSLVSAVNEHVGNTSNPHNTTASQVGAYSKTEADAKFRTIDEQRYLAWYTTTVGKTLTSNTWNRLTFNVAKVNAGSMYNSGADTFTIQKSGWYRFSCNILVHLQASAGAYVEVWQVGGAAVKHQLIGIFATVGESWNSPSGEGFINCTQGEVYEFVVKQTSTDSRPLNSFNCLIERL